MSIRKEDSPYEARRQFLEDARSRGKSMGLASGWVELVLNVIQGMPAWQALSDAMIDDEKLRKQIEASIDTTTLVGLERLNSHAQRILMLRQVRVFRKWIEEQLSQNEEISFESSAWTFENSESELRYIIELSKRGLVQGGTFNTLTAGTMLSAIKELNTMHRFTGAHATSRTGSAVVVFSGEDDLR